ncbi:hypothetical protein GCM10011506_46820 [Marivirga lumbricoides]|uniref:Uncharacterized protein n=3 Tax=Marivirga lumbricoides TaxID=1046115 RepID=A0ABQ1N788_9BACT|nr:hypothetical protein GCM10011506_46820 [Marivirga lumbricoides]
MLVKMKFISLHSNFDKEVTMAGTSLKRKARKNRVVAKKRVDNIKRLQQKPVIKNVDVEEIKAEFEKADKKPVAKKEEETAKGAKAEAKTEDAPKAKKAAPKKKAATEKSDDAPKAKKSEDKKEDK